jgi:hypothetical protein
MRERRSRWRRRNLPPPVAFSPREAKSPQAKSPQRRGRACPGHPRLGFARGRKTGVPGTSSAKTRFALLPGHDERRRVECGMITSGRQPARVTRSVFLLPHTRSNSGDWRNILRSEDGPASGSRSFIPEETQSGFASGVLEGPVLIHQNRTLQGHHRDSHEKDHSSNCSRWHRLHRRACRRSRRADLHQGARDDGPRQQLDRLVCRCECRLGWWGK